MLLKSMLHPLCRDSPQVEFPFLGTMDNLKAGSLIPASRENVADKLLLGLTVNGWIPERQDELVLFGQLERSFDLPTSFLGGSLRNFWVADMIGRLKGVAAFEELCDELDEYITLKAVSGTAICNGFDLTHGVSGAIAYASHRERFTGNTRVTDALIAILEDSCSVTRQGIYWWSNPSIIDGWYILNGASGGIIDLGMAHGQAGVIAVLSKVLLRRGRERGRVEKLLREAVKWFTVCGASHSVGDTSVYTNRVDDVAVSRFAWCYGDLGVLSALLLARRALQSSEFEALIERLCNRLGARSAKSYQIAEASVCHGSAGAALLCHRIYLELDLPQFERLRAYFLEQLRKQYQSAPQATVHDLYLEGELGVQLVCRELERETSQKIDMFEPLALC